ncbi:MAG TPA: hypothetical protein VGO53_14045 [Steroidobacteraceae bacterium]|jgi:hypothetical protein|nr:hypothetical protein [Steroidobacteraceae bacterium]
MSSNHHTRFPVDESGQAHDRAGSPAEAGRRKRADDTPCDADAEFTRVARATKMGEVAISLASEVNETLAAIVTNAETCLLWLAKDKPDLGRARKAAERIVRDGHQASDVVKSLRTMLQDQERPRDSE